MVVREKIFSAVTYSGLSVLTIGVIAFILGLFVNGFEVLISIGIGTVVGAVFIFLIGVFWVLSEEMLETEKKCS